MSPGRNHFENAIAAYSKLSEAGWNSCLWGDCVREILSGKWPEGYSIRTDCPGQQIESLFQISKSTGYEVVHEGTRIEIVPEGSVDKVLTVDGMRMTVNGRVYPTKFLEDLESQSARPIVLFGWNSGTCLEATARSAELGLSVHPDLQKAISSVAGGCADIPGEVVSRYLLRVAAGGGKTMAAWLEAMDGCGILQSILPEFAKMKTCHQKASSHPEGATVRKRLPGGGLSQTSEPYDPENPSHRNTAKYTLKLGTVYDHILHSLRACRTNNPLVVLGTMFHDIGKPAAMHFVDGLVRYKGHDNSVYFNALSQRLRLPEEVSFFIRFCIDNHMEVHRLPSMPLHEAAMVVGDPSFPLLMEVVYSDTFCAGVKGRHRKIERYEELQKHAGWMLGDGLPSLAQKLQRAMTKRRVDRLSGGGLSKIELDDAIFQAKEYAMEKQLDPDLPEFDVEVGKYLRPRNGK